LEPAESARILSYGVCANNQYYQSEQNKNGVAKSLKALQLK